MISPQKLRKLLCLAENICEEDEIIVRAIFDSSAAGGNPAKLKENKPSIRCFLPRHNKEKTAYVGNLSVIHENSRDFQTITCLARSINTVELKYLARSQIKYIAQLNNFIKEKLEGQNLSTLDVIRDDNPFEGHAEILPMPTDIEAGLRIANQLRRVFREHGDLDAPAPLCKPMEDLYSHTK